MAEGNQGQPAEQPAAPVAGSEDRSMGMICHLLGLVGFIGPLIIWLIKKDQSPVVDREGKKALNFQLTVLIAWVAGFVLCFVIIGFVLLPLVWLFWLIFTILAAVKTNAGEDYKYPFAITFLK